VDSTRRPTYPEGKVIGTLDAAAVDAVTAALTAAGFAADQIGVFTAADAEGIEPPLDQPGLPGLIDRFLLSLGSDLDWLERARRELAAGHVIVSVPVEGDDAQDRVRDILRDHGAQSITYFGRWSITSLG
jgi:hypothetical protein